MGKNIEITLEEQKQVQFEMLKEIDTFCRSNGIKYSLAFGTLLGAIRHKGFIPWDDDVDIMMPLDDLLQFKRLFKSNTLKYCDVDTDSNYEFPFSRITNTKTYTKQGLIAKSYGISIDLYPIIRVPNDTNERESYFKNAELIAEKRFTYLRMRSRLLKYLPIKTIPGFHKTMKEFRDYLLKQNSFDQSSLFYIVAGPLNVRDTTMYDYDFFKELTEVDFENNKFLAISQYDKYLKQRYGDYMQLPPEGERHPYHGYDYYWK